MPTGETSDAFNATAQDWQIEFADQLDRQRERARQLFASKQEELSNLEDRLSGQLHKIQSQLLHYETDLVDQTARHSAESEAAQELQLELEKRQTELAALSQQVFEQQEASAKQQHALSQQHQQMLNTLSQEMAKLQIEQQSRTEFEARLAAEEARQAEKHREIHDRQQALLDLQSKLRQQQQTLAAEQEHLLTQQTALQKREERLTVQRREVARALKSQKHALVRERELTGLQAQADQKSDVIALGQQLAEVTQRQAQAQTDLVQLNIQLERCQFQLTQRDQELTKLKQDLTQLDTVAKEADAKNQALQEELAQAKAENDSALHQARALAQSTDQKVSADAAQMQVALQAANEQASQQAQEITRLTEEIETLQAKRRQQASMAAEQAVEWDRERKELSAQMEALRNAPAAAPAESGISAAAQQEIEDLRSRLDLAMHDVRELKAKNQSLEQDAKKPAAEAKAGTPATWSSGMDWETQKKLLMQQMEEDLDTSNPEEAGQKLRIEEVIRSTDKIIAEKERAIQEMKTEVVELRRLLENQGDNIGQYAVGASAIAGMLDTDELIVLERENLKSLQENLREQLRKAEVDISLERAKVARDRLELEARFSQFEEERAHVAKQQGSAPASNGNDKSGKKNPGSKWFNRMGLGGGES